MRMNTGGRKSKIIPVMLICLALLFAVFSAWHTHIDGAHETCPVCVFISGMKSAFFMLSLIFSGTILLNAICALRKFSIFPPPARKVRTLITLKVRLNP
jgi:hypothetical protein